MELTFIYWTSFNFLKNKLNYVINTILEREYLTQ